mgnify:CR=1 FL=1
MMPLLIRGENKKLVISKAEKILKDVKILNRSNHFPNELSGGEQQRVAIARALIAETKLILADEPTGNLDSKSGNEILKFFSKLHKDGNTIIVVTHEEEIAQHCQRVNEMKDGNIFSDNRSEIKANQKAI